MQNHIVLKRVRLTKKHQPAGKTRHYRGGELIPSPHELMIVRYEYDPGFYLIYLNRATLNRCMPKYKVSLRGTGCWLHTGRSFRGLGRRQPPRRVGFYTTRFIEADSPEEAGRRAVESVTQEVSAYHLPDRPWSVTVEDVHEDEAGFEMHAPGAGFSWYPVDEPATDNP